MQASMLLLALILTKIVNMRISIIIKLNFSTKK